MDSINNVGATIVVSDIVRVDTAAIPRGAPRVSFVQTTSGNEYYVLAPNYFYSLSLYAFAGVLAAVVAGAKLTVWVMKRRWVW